MADSKIPSDDNVPRFTASDIKSAAGLSYRQLNDWDSKGAIPTGRSDADAAWRRFTLREVFIVMVCAEIHRSFGTPAESQRWLTSVMSQKEANHFHAAIEMMAAGLSVWLLTDLTDTFELGSDLYFEDKFRVGDFTADGNPHRYLFIQINEMVNRMLACVKGAKQLEVDLPLINEIRRAKAGASAQSVEELEIMRLIRRKEYHRVVVHKADGTVARIEVDQELKADAESDVAKALRDGDFQTVTAKKQAGRIVRATRTRVVKFGDAGSKKKPRSGSANLNTGGEGSK